MQHLLLLGIGLFAGLLSGMFGIGGGLIIVPALLYLLKMQELDAIGTSLAALIPPVGLLGAAEYWRNHVINVRFALIIATGLFIGAYFGAKITLGLPANIVRGLYGAFLIVVGVRILFFET